MYYNMIVLGFESAEEKERMLKRFYWYFANEPSKRFGKFVGTLRKNDGSYLDDESRIGGMYVRYKPPVCPDSYKPVYTHIYDVPMILEFNEYEDNQTPPEEPFPIDTYSEEDVGKYLYLYRRDEDKPDSAEIDKWVSDILDLIRQVIKCNIVKEAESLPPNIKSTEVKHIRS